MAPVHDLSMALSYKVSDPRSPSSMPAMGYHWGDAQDTTALLSAVQQQLNNAAKLVEFVRASFAWVDSDDDAASGALAVATWVGDLVAGPPLQAAVLEMAAGLDLPLQMQRYVMDTSHPQRHCLELHLCVDLLQLVAELRRVRSLHPRYDAWCHTVSALVLCRARSHSVARYEYGQLVLGGFAPVMEAPRVTEAVLLEAIDSGDDWMGSLVDSSGWRYIPSLLAWKEPFSSGRLPASFAACVGSRGPDSAMAWHMALRHSDCVVLESVADVQAWLQSLDKRLTLSLLSGAERVGCLDAVLNPLCHQHYPQRRVVALLSAAVQGLLQGWQSPPANSNILLLLLDVGRGRKALPRYCDATATTNCSLLAAEADLVKSWATQAHSLSRADQVVVLVGNLEALTVRPDLLPLSSPIPASVRAVRMLAFHLDEAILSSASVWLWCDDTAEQRTDWVTLVPLWHQREDTVALYRGWNV